MGFSVSWVGFLDTDLAIVCDELQLTKGQEVVEFFDTEIAGSDLPNNWCHVHLEKFDSKYHSEYLIRKLSVNTTVIVCQVEEHLMYSKVSCWDQGNMLWSIEHDAQQGIEHLVLTGEPPPQFEEIKAKNLAQQDGSSVEVDYIFEIPLEVAEVMTDIRHDSEPDSDAKYYALNEITLTSKKPWWRFW